MHDPSHCENLNSSSKEEGVYENSRHAMPKDGKNSCAGWKEAGIRDGCRGLAYRVVFWMRQKMRQASRFVVRGGQLSPRTRFSSDLVCSNVVMKGSLGLNAAMGGASRHVVWSH